MRGAKRYIIGLVLGLSIPIAAQEVLPVPADTILPARPIGTDTMRRITPDTTMLFALDSTLSGKADTTTAQHQTIDARIDYSCADSLIMMGNGVAHLYGNGELKYKAMDLKSAYIKAVMDSSLLYAQGVYDSIDNEWTGLPVFSDGEESYESNALAYNLKTQKGLIRHVVTEQGEGYIIADKTKKQQDDLMMMKGGQYTTCADHDNPHFYLQLTKAKVKPGKYIASGPAYLVVGEVPLPLAIPFGFFPFTTQYSSGLIMPNFGDDASRGLYLSGLGYYFAVNDYMDLELKGDIYTKGTWAISATSRYLKRYRFNGNISINYRWDVTGEKDMPDYNVAKNLSVQWTHSQDSKANPYNSFSASVNFKTSGYNRSNINSYYNVQANSENTTSSSINYTQRFPDSPWNISMSMNLTQRTKDSTISLSLPSLTWNMSRIYPFKRKIAVGKERWYEKISMQYNGNLANSITCKENYLFKSDFYRDWSNSCKHNFSTSASFTAFKYISITPSITAADRMYLYRVDQSWDEVNNTVQRDTIRGFYNVYNFSASVSMSTKLYGFFIPYRKWFGDKIDRVRHVLTPSVSLNYHPDFGKSYWAPRYGGFYGTYDKLVTTKNSEGEVVPKYDANGNPIYETVNYCRFKEGPGQGAAASLSFSLGNNLEMKVRNDKDTTGNEAYKVVSLIDNLSISGGYNFIADSMNWSNFNVGLRIKVPGTNYTLNLSGAFDPYMYTTTASGSHVRCNELYWNHGRFPHFTGTHFSFSYTFNNETFKKWFAKKDDKKDNKSTNTDKNSDSDTDADNNADNRTQADDTSPSSGSKHQAGEKRGLDEENYMFTEIPWSLGVSYNLTYGSSSEWDEERNYYKMELRHNLSFTASLGLGKGWKASTSLSYDVNAKKLSYSSINVSRDLHCWSMSASFVPFGPYKSYTFHIGVNASMLSDLKYDKNSTDSSNPQVNWW